MLSAYYAYTVRDEALQQRMHELIERQVRQIALLTASLCQMSGPRLENLQPELQRIDLCSVLRKAAETVTSEYSERHHQLLVGLPESSARVLGDAAVLSRYRKSTLQCVKILGRRR